MKVHMTPPLAPRRGDPVEVGNVYANAHGSPHYKIVVSVISRDAHDQPWNNCVCLHTNGAGDIVGCSKAPQLYLSEHNDLVGRIRELPELTVEWIRSHPQKDKINAARTRT